MKKKINLEEIAYARSGDKGSSSNVGVIFINKNLYNWGVVNLTEERIGKYFESIALGGVTRYLMDNINAINYILHDSLDGGGSESLLNDAQGKTHAQAILRMELEVPLELLNIDE